MEACGTGKIEIGVLACQVGGILGNNLGFLLRLQEDLEMETEVV